MINLELPKNLVQLQQSVHALAVGLLRPIARKYDKAEHDKPVELDSVADMMRGSRGARGLGAAAPVGEGIRNGSQMAGVVSTAEMAWGCTGLSLSMPGGGLGNAAIGAVATAEQKERFGAVYASMAITEPGAGSDSSAVSTTARRDGDEWVLNGEKIFVTAGGRCNAVVVWATVDKSKGKAAIKSFVVQKGTPGMEVVRLEYKLGIRASDTATITFTDCRIPFGNILGSPEVADTEEGRKKSFGGVMQTFDNTRPGVAAMAQGCAQSALDMAREVLAKEGVKLDYSKSLFSSTALEAELYRMEAELEAVRLLILKAAWMADNRQPNSLEASMCKAKAGRIGNYITLRCVELCKGLGYSEELLLEKFARDSKIMDIFEGTQQIQQLIVARRVLGVSSSQLK